ncbi:GNAT family N-acetyltransferase [Paenibacillus jamilae]|uniref:GNAT family N-acetyltransferase n=1 Tax=Paenibacillus TaxID=44249 RepID=UPI001AE7A3D7|nr:GNAT family N-acetyltransferase [Paenibacillus sp. PvR133]MBP1177493.1 RimJ/RimL family protein N-acetyltransferase [Paenibacillus sp. PvR133]
MHSEKNPYSLSIECKDIILREYQLEDLNQLQVLTWQPEIYGFLPGWNVEKEVRLDWLKNYEIPENNQFLKLVEEGLDVGDLRLRLGIVLKETGEFIGWCCSGIKDDLPVPNREIMYGISKEHRSKGYTTQAVQGIIQYLFDNTEIKELNAIALLENGASNRVIQKSNFKFVGEIEIDDEIYNHYKINKIDF